MVEGATSIDQLSHVYAALAAADNIEMLKPENWARWSGLSDDDGSDDEKIDLRSAIAEVRRQLEMGEGREGGEESEREEREEGEESEGGR